MASFRAAGLLSSLLFCGVFACGFFAGTAQAESLPEAPRLGGRIDGYGIVPFDNRSPGQYPALRADVWAEQAVTRDLLWRISLIGRWGGPPKDPRVGFFELDRTFQNYSPSLEFGETYLDYTGDDFDVRVGLQKFFWGRLDSLQPNDLLSPREWEDPFLTDAVDAKIAVPAVSGSYYPLIDSIEEWVEEPRFTLVWQPIAVPWRFPLLDERWYPPTGIADPFLATDDPKIPCPPTAPCPITQTVENVSAPARTFDNGNVGVQIGGRSAGADWSLVFWDGFDTSPAFQVPIRVDLSTSTINTKLQPAYQRFQAIGGDFALASGGFTFRGEANWRFRKPYPMDLSELADRVIANDAKVATLLKGNSIVEPAYVKRDSLAWGLGVDYLIEGFLPILEVYQLILLHNDQPLLVQNVDTRISANISRKFLRDRLEGELIGIWGIESGYELTRATVSFDLTQDLQIRAGLLGIWGREQSLVGQFKQNGEFFGGLRYQF
ncbi:MAG: hypothetical protein FJ144_15290 [Deltaproteobacteria bacterium]|nr:hypothetical protein [Deltaproteobacteria bacterium]